MTLVDRGGYSIYLTEKNTKRLPAPYTSNCVDSSKVSNIFSNKYTYGSCKETCLFEDTLMECKDVYPFWRKLVTGQKQPADDQDHNLTKKTKECLYSHRIAPNCKCNHACAETTYDVTREVVAHESKGWRLVLIHKEVVTQVELPDYPIQEYLGALGGVIGLGMKFMLMLQLIVFICLSIIYSIKKEP